MSKDRLKVSAVIPTFNEECNIERAIKSVLWADEVIVVDSFSTDNTVKIAQGLGAKIIQREYENSAEQKNWTIPQAQNEWVFLIDADEYASDELIQEVQAVLVNPQKDAYWIKRRNFFMGKKVNFSAWQSDKVIRLFKRDSCKYEDKKVHAEIITEGKVGFLNKEIVHHTYRGFDHYIQKIERYSSWKAYEKVEKGNSGSFFMNVFVKPNYRFVYHFFLRFGFLDGKVGFIISSLYAYEVFLRGVKIWRINKGETLEKR